ncbi:hypothetical protein IEQ34_000531 [Dendrobium chrysotoxum]|uniref:Uncharacterized protein n=1 Tax=Dendrobium chrysotoxum TaxID=161865 RepID=A0AAV7HTF6_DENCH|nr:hypothetical protein IEQ34_000531 [Dendrobium chrysotoxum]
MAGGGGQLKFLDWYLKIAAVSALVGASMELFMIHTGFCVRTFLLPLSTLNPNAPRRIVRYIPWLYREHCAMALHLPLTDDKVTVLESEKRAWESSPEAQAMKEALNPWRRLDEEKSKP